MKSFVRLLTLAALALPCAMVAQPKTLDIYLIDVEGGQATLFVTPEKGSLLVDTGWGEPAGRDADRIVQAAKLAGLHQIDNVIITHYHMDHVAGFEALAAKFPVRHVIDHGVLYESGTPVVVSDFNHYTQFVKEHDLPRTSVEVGNSVPLNGARVRVVSAGGAVLTHPLPGAGEANPFCAKSETRSEDLTENGHSVGFVLTFGKFRTIDLGDLTWDREMKMMCPANNLGTVSLLVVSHHGFEQSSSPALVDALAPEVAVMDNGENKGGSKPTVQTVGQIPGLKALYQLHRSKEAGPDNTDEARIANLSGDVSEDKAFYIKVSAKRDGSFSVFNARTGKSEAYPAR